MGEIRHRKDRHNGQQQTILDRQLWDLVELRLRDRAAREREQPNQSPPSPLTGKLFDENGEHLYVTYTSKGPSRYRYYLTISSVLNEAGMNAAELDSSLRAFKALLDRSENAETLSQMLLSVVVRVALLKDGIQVELNLASLIPREIELLSDARLSASLG